MITSLDVLTLVMVDGVIGQCNGGLVVHLQQWHSRRRSHDFFKQPSQPHALARRRCCYNILSFTRGEGHHLLLLILASDGTLCKEVDVACGALAIIHVPGHVAIAVAT